MSQSTIDYPPKAPVDPSPTRKTTASTLRPPGRMGTVLLLIASLVGAGALRQVAADRQSAIVNTRGSVASRSSLGNMDSFALALLLGGLRGPLVMCLWPAIESQKADHNLEDVDTMIEWVRLLQPEFVSVHIFQIWNKAYNISAMMASPANKYTVIMEALNYAENVDKERPGDVNILNSITNVYGGKLASSTLPEFAFYSRQFREESMTVANRIKAYPEDQSHFARLDRGEPLLDENNDLLPKLLKPTRPRPADLKAGAEWNDGSELQYLKAYEPYPYGVSAFGMSFNYAKRAEVAVSAEGQKVLQLSTMVVDSRPGLQLKFWGEDENRRARAYEARAIYGDHVPPLGDELYRALAGFKLSDKDKLRDPAAIPPAIYYYQSAARLAHDSLVEYERHLNKPAYVTRISTYRSHLADLRSAEPMGNADHDYLAAMLSTDPGQRMALLHNASENYYNAMLQFERSMLWFYTEPEILEANDFRLPGGRVLPPGFQHSSDIPKMPDSLVSSTFDKVMIEAAYQPNIAEHSDERSDYRRSVQRCRMRMLQISEELKK